MAKSKAVLVKLGFIFTFLMIASLLVFLAYKSILSSDNQIEFLESLEIKKTNNFVYKVDSQLWFGKVDGSQKPELQKITDNVINYSISPSKDSIAYISEGYLKVNIIEGTLERILQRVILEGYSPKDPEPEDIKTIKQPESISWSPDGGKLAFVASFEGEANIYCVDVNGENLKKLTNDKLNEFSLAWSPDGGKIAFQQTANFGTGAGFSSNLVVMDQEGKNQITLALNSQLPDGHRFMPAQDLRWISNEELIFWAWSVIGPDGIWKVNLQNKEIAPLTTERGKGPVVWSEKNKKFLYPSLGKSLIIVGIDGKVETIETTSEVDKVIWSADSQKILFSIVDNPNQPKELVTELFIANKDGSQVLKVLSGQFMLMDIAISSDNKKIVYNKRMFEPETHSQLCLINANGTNEQKIDSAPMFYELYTTPYTNFAIYSTKYVTYWLNLDNYSKETLLESEALIYPEFLGM